jgi:hypothetical protein
MRQAVQRLEFVLMVQGRAGSSAPALLVEANLKARRSYKELEMCIRQACGYSSGFYEQFAVLPFETDGIANLDFYAGRFEHAGWRSMNLAASFLSSIGESSAQTWESFNAWHSACTIASQQCSAIFPFAHNYFQPHL